MTDITFYKPSRYPNVRDYPDRVGALIDVLQGFIAELENARSGETTLDARVDNVLAACAQLSGLTANLNVNGKRLTSAADPIAGTDLCNLQTVQSIASGGGTPSNIAVTSLGVGSAVDGQLLSVSGGAVVGNSAALAAAKVAAHRLFKGL